MLWIGSSASPQVLKDLVNVDDTLNVDPRMVRTRSRNLSVHARRLNREYHADAPPPLADPPVHSGAKRFGATVRPEGLRSEAVGDSSEHGR